MITYDLDGGSVSSANPASYTIETTTFALSNPTKAGYAFVGWTGTNGTTPQTSVSISKGNTGDRNYTANWTLNTYIVTFNANGGTVSPASGTTGEGGTLASLPTPSKTDCIFDGWYTASTGGTEVTESRVYSASATIYAQWTRVYAVFTDSRNDKTYNKVTIGEQVWMAENLNYDVPDNTTDVCYSNADSNCDKYGRLYNWSTAMNGASSSSTNPSGVQGVCPVGWHLPSNAEWTQLTDYVGGTSKAGTKLKSSMGWNSYSGIPVGTDEYGFSALPGGDGYSGGDFYYAGYNGYWWSATEVNAYNA
jgi:uncharacterized protein (TIGR02145 family)/uncharacterized repeat protein (TIGR02543 family)